MGFGLWVKSQTLRPRNVSKDSFWPFQVARVKMVFGQVFIFIASFVPLYYLML